MRYSVESYNLRVEPDAKHFELPPRGRPVAPRRTVHPGKLVEDLPVSDLYLVRLARLTEDHRTAPARGPAASELNDVAKAVAAARVGVLLVEADRVIPGRFDPATGEVRPGRLADPEVDDVIDELAEAVLRTGGEVVVVPAGRMPTDTGLAATFRH